MWSTKCLTPSNIPHLVQYKVIIFASCTERGQFPMKFAQVMIWLLTHQTRFKLQRI